MEMEIKKPTGDFILTNAEGTQTENGVYYHYSEVCNLLKKYEKKLFIDSNVEQSEKLINFLKWVGDGYDFDKNAEAIVKEYLNEGN